MRSSFVLEKIRGALASDPADAKRPIELSKRMANPVFTGVLFSASLRRFVRQPKADIGGGGR